MSDFLVKIDTSKLDQKLGAMPGRLQSGILNAVKRLAINLQGYVKESKLSGQVLNVRTGTLRRSINQEVTQSGSMTTGIVGTNVSYAKVHEYGFSGEVSVKEHLRTITQAFGRPLAAPKVVTVRAHAMMMNLPERSFLRSALLDFEPRIKKELQQAANEAIA